MSKGENMLERAKVLIMSHERAVVRWALAGGLEEQSRIWNEQVKPAQDNLRSALSQPNDEGEGK